jgi:uncharacterized protein
MDIASLKNALLDPGIYPDHPMEVGLRETHISLLFLTGNFAYKVKKPVDFGFLDFTSLEKRKYFCGREVVLNRRLAPDLYLGVVAITDDRGRIGLDAAGETIEYAVKMKQIPEELLMGRLLEKGRVTPGMIDALSEKLIRFYEVAETSETIAGFGRADRVKQDTDENFEQTERYVGVALSREVFSAIRERTNEFLEKEKSLFERRIASQKIRDCHGDLRMEHIAFGEEIVIFDCIEFNQRFRYTDLAADIAFLSMDLDYRDRKDLANRLTDGYIERSRDEALRGILPFYKCYRAYVRGKVECFRSDDPAIGQEESRISLERAKQYFDLAFEYAKLF